MTDSSVMWGSSSSKSQLGVVYEITVPLIPILLYDRVPHSYNRELFIRLPCVIDTNYRV